MQQTVRFLYGQVMAASGSLREGTVLMEQALDELESMDWQEQYAAYARILLDYYAREGKPGYIRRIWRLRTR